MSETTTAGNPSVEAVLAAIGKGCLHHLCPAEESRLLAGMVGRVEAGVKLSTDDQRAAARLIKSLRPHLEGPLGMMGFDIPAEPDPVTRAHSASKGARVTQVKLLETGKIGIRSPYALMEMIRALPGCKRGSGWAVWTVPGTPASAAGLLATLEPFGFEASRGVQSLAESYAASQDARAMLADGAPEPDGGDGTDVVMMPLWTHQRRAVAYAEVAQASVWAIRMGGGKTGAAIAAANRVQASTVLIVAPNRVRAVWTREVRERSAVGWHIEDGTRASHRRGGRRQDLAHPERLERLQHVLWDCQCGAPVHAFVLNYEALTQGVWQKWAPPHKLDLIIYDEAHRLKAYREKVKPRKLKGPAEKALGDDATPAEIRAARADDMIGPRERGLSPEAGRTEILVARAADATERKRIEEERANRLTTSGVAARWVQWSHRRIALTGTPFPQHPWDIFGLYRAVDPGVFGTVWTPFRDKFIRMNKGGTFPVKIEPSMMREFAADCMSLMYRPKVDLNLPGCTDVLRTVELEEKARKSYDQLDVALWTDLSEWIKHKSGTPIEDSPVRIDGEPIDLAEIDPGAPAQLTARNVLSRLLRLQQFTGGTVRTDPIKGPDGRKMPGLEARVSHAKTDELAEFENGALVGGILDEIGCVPGRKDNDGKLIEPEPLVVFCRFTSDLDAVKEVAEKAGLRYGEISGRRGDGLNAEARMSADHDIVAVNVQAGGTGVDLTRARYAVWYSLGYSVSDYDQARARLYRPGQTRPVVYIHLVANNTQDQAVYAAIKARRDAVAAVLLAGGVDPSEVGVVEEMIQADPTAEAVEGIDNASVAVALPWEK